MNWKRKKEDATDTAERRRVSDIITYASSSTDPQVHALLKKLEFLLKLKLSDTVTDATEALPVFELTLMVPTPGKKEEFKELILKWRADEMNFQYGDSGWYCVPNNNKHFPAKIWVQSK